MKEKKEEEKEKEKEKKYRMQISFIELKSIESALHVKMKRSLLKKNKKMKSKEENR